MNWILIALLVLSYPLAAHGRHEEEEDEIAARDRDRNTLYNQMQNQQEEQWVTGNPPVYYQKCYGQCRVSPGVLNSEP